MVSAKATSPIGRGRGSTGPSNDCSVRARPRVLWRRCRRGDPAYVRAGRDELAGGV